MQSVNGAREFHLLYLHFDRDGVLQRTEIEGPVPVCSAVYEDLRHCPYREQNARRQGLREYKFHESRVMKDAAA